jgi:hypothetical protein
VKAASSVEENMNVLQQTFRNNTQAVLDWSKTSGEAMGRSQYSLQEYAGTFGSFLEPVFKNTGIGIADMSMQMSQLAVDLASFYNTSDEEAKMRLFSGLSGETEAVRRFGINLSDERLTQLNKEINGEKVKYKYLDLAGKTQLRIAAIQRDTTAKQGDAVRTAGSWANSLKRVQEKYKTMTVLVGQKLMPAAKKLLRYVEQLVNALAPAVAMFVKYSGAIKTALFLSAGMASLWAGSLALSLINLPKIIAYFTAFAGPLALVTASFIAIEDVFAFLDGKKSIFGDVIRGITDSKAPLAWFENKMARIAEILMGMRSPAALAVTATRVAQGGSFTPLADRSEKAQADSREQGRQDAVKAGDGKKFVANMEPNDSANAPDAALMQYKAQRAVLLKKNPAMATADDVADGTATLAQQVIGDVARAKATQDQATADKKAGKLSPAAEAAKKKQEEAVTYSNAYKAEAKRVGLKIEVEVKGNVSGSGKGGAEIGPEVGEQMTKALEKFNWSTVLPGAGAGQ